MIDADITFWISNEFGVPLRNLTGICIGAGDGAIHVLCLVFRRMEVFVINESDIINIEEYRS